MTPLQKPTIAALVFVGILATGTLGYFAFELDTKMLATAPKTEAPKTQTQSIVSDFTGGQSGETVKRESKETTVTTHTSGSSIVAQQNMSDDDMIAAGLKTQSGSTHTGTTTQDKKEDPKETTTSGTAVETTTATESKESAPSLFGSDESSGATLPNYSQIEAEKIALKSYLSRNDFVQAGLTYDRLMKLDSKNIKIHVEGTKLFLLKVKDKKKALEYAQAFYQSNPHNAQALNSYGWALLENGSENDAEEILLAAKTLDSSIPEIFYNLGVLSEKKQQPHDALAYYQEAVRIDSLDGAIGSMAKKRIETLSKQ